MKHSTKFSLLSYIPIVGIGIIMGYLELTVTTWEFWVILLFIASYGSLRGFEGRHEAEEHFAQDKENAQ